jgi:hypothetical protein
MGYELSIEKRDRLKTFLLDNEYESEVLDDLNTHNFLGQLFYTEQDEKITSWQVKVRIIEIKHLIGISESVYCIVEIGDQKFRTKEKSIDNLDFNNEDEVKKTSLFIFYTCKLEIHLTTIFYE